MCSQVLRPGQSLNEIKSPATMGQQKMKREQPLRIAKNIKQKYQICFIQVSANTQTGADYKNKEIKKIKNSDL